MKNNILKMGCILATICCAYFTMSAQHHFWQDPISENPDLVMESFSVTDMNLQDLDWSYVNNSRQKIQYSTKEGLIIECKQQDGMSVTPASFTISPDMATLLLWQFNPLSLNDKSMVGVVYNYVDTENFEGFLFDKSNFYVIRCKEGRISNVRTGQNLIKSKTYMPAIGFEDGKIYYMYYDPKYSYFDELWVGGGELTTEVSGFIVVGKNKISASSIGFVQNIKVEDDE